MITTGKIFGETHPNNYRDWVIGSFVNDSKFNNKNFEFKFQQESKGLIREPKPVMNVDTTTLAILIDGHLRMNFGEKDIYLKDRGEYIWWKPDVPHLFEYLEDSLVITLRW